MKGLTRLSAAVAAAFSSPLVGHSAAAQGRAPNIVVIVADDLGYADLGAHGGKDIPTRAMVALRQGDWKLVSMHDGPPREEPAPLGDVSQAELYNLKNDIGETRNLAAEQPGKMKEMAGVWLAWSAKMAKPRFGFGGRGGAPPLERSSK